jgi:hypothetical protein
MPNPNLLKANQLKNQKMVLANQRLKTKKNPNLSFLIQRREMKIDQMLIEQPRSSKKEKDQEILILEI